MTPEELEKLRIMRRGLLHLWEGLTKIDNWYQDDMAARSAVAERGRLIIIALAELCEILEGKQPVSNE